MEIAQACFVFATASGALQRAWAGRKPGARRRLWIVLGLLSSGLWAPPAAAHSTVIQTEPADGEILAAAPASLIVWFSQELESGPSGLQLLDQHGNQIDGISGGLDLHDPEHQRLQAVVAAPLAPGSYIVRWTAVSAEDGDRTEGEFRFEVRPESAAE